jgi:hypothetical protein
MKTVSRQSVKDIKTFADACSFLNVPDIETGRMLEHLLTPFTTEKLQAVIAFIHLHIPTWNFNGSVIEIENTTVKRISEEDAEKKLEELQKEYFQPIKLTVKSTPKGKFPECITVKRLNEMECQVVQYQEGRDWLWQMSKVLTKYIHLHENGSLQVELANGEKHDFVIVKMEMDNIEGEWNYVGNAMTGAGTGRRKTYYLGVNGNKSVTIGEIYDEENAKKIVQAVNSLPKSK